MFTCLYFKLSEMEMCALLFFDHIPVGYLSLGSEENKPQRVVRSVSEGNLSLLEQQKSKSIFFKTTQHLKQVAKRM